MYNIFTSSLMKCEIAQIFYDLTVLKMSCKDYVRINYVPRLLLIGDVSHFGILQGIDNKLIET